MPFLSCFEKADQNNLVEILPGLHAALKQGKLMSDSLAHLDVSWTHVTIDVQVPGSELDLHLIRCCVLSIEGTGVAVFQRVMG